jgi:SAM-dependent methyltransferase
MTPTEPDNRQLHRLVTDTLLADDFRRASFGGVARGAVPWPWVRVAVRPIRLRGERQLQFSYFDRKKNVARNFPLAEATGPLDEILCAAPARIHLSTQAEEIDIQTTRKGKIIIGRRAVRSPLAVPDEAHNRIKDVPLPEGKADRVLEVMGILTHQGQVRAAMRPKYTQINEFLKQITHVLDDAELRSLGRELQILDCGCGSSYLTLAAHHYLNDVLSIPARILGVDVNEEVIRKSVERSERLGAQGIDFACGRIGSVDTRPDIVLALHACDTATDDAIAQAVRSEAKVLLSVPCCHHHLNDRLRGEGPAGVLRPLLRHGILQQRTADLVTDAFRALALRIMGYRTDVVEFISHEHTARNLMIRAVRGPAVGDPAFVREYVEMRNFWGVVPYIEQALGEPFQRLVPANDANAPL